MMISIVKQKTKLHKYLKYLSIFIALALTISLLPQIMFAAETDGFTVTVFSEGEGAYSAGESSGGDYKQGETINISAGSPPGGKRFVNWTNSDSSVVFQNKSDENTSFIMPAHDVVVTAVWEAIDSTGLPEEFNIEFSVTSGAAIGYGSSYTKAPEGTTVTVVAGTANDGWEFAEWESDPTVNFADAGNPVTSFAMIGEPVKITGVYKELFDIEFSVTSGAAIDSEVSHTEATEGTIVSIDAGTPNSGWTFMGWQSDSSIDFADAYNPQTTFAMLNEPVRVTGVYNDSSAPVEPGFIPVTDISGVVSSLTEGSSVILAGMITPANATNREIIWTLVNAGNTGAVMSGNRLSVSSTGSLTVNACIIKGKSSTEDFNKEFTISVTVRSSTSDDGSSGNDDNSNNEEKERFRLYVEAEVGGEIVRGGGRYEEGEEVDIRAEADGGYEFDRWISSDGGKFDDDRNDRTTFTMPGESTIVTAHFDYVGDDDNKSAGDDKRTTGGNQANDAVIQGNSIEPRKVSFQQSAPSEITIEMDSSSNYTLRRVRCGTDILVEDDDYYINGNACVIRSEYLSTLGTGDKILTFDMNAGGNPQLIISISR